MLAMKAMLTFVLLAAVAHADEFDAQSGVDYLKVAYTRQKRVSKDGSGVEALKAAYARQKSGSISVAQAAVTPVQKVIELLQGMLEKGKKREA
jgi:hypothetical protein